jgi:hypothetical protein
MLSVIYDDCQNKVHCDKCHYSERHYAECCSAEHCAAHQTYQFPKRGLFSSKQKHFHSTQSKDKNIFRCCKINGQVEAELLKYFVISEMAMNASETFSQSYLSV